jgi:hypothetical protein
VIFHLRTLPQIGGMSHALANRRNEFFSRFWPPEDSVHNRMKPTMTFLSRSFDIFGRTLVTSVVAGAALTALVACQRSQWHEVSKTPNTGDQFAEPQVAPRQVAPMRSGDPGFVSTDHLPTRTSVKQAPEEAPAHLERNDKIQIIDPAPDGDDSSVEATVVDTQQPHLKGKKVILPKKYIASAPVVPSNEDNERDKYFMIQNIATERVRVYRNCASKDASGTCVHKMVFETEMTAGENTPDQSRRTILGSYRIQRWFKFYEDHAHYFPSFYSPAYPELPKHGAHAELKDWMSPKLLPEKGGVMRGSFGWYTAYLTPDASNQWTHGTFGWSEDGEKFIRAVKDPSSDLIQDAKSQGCTRVENQAIALMREILPPGTRVIKIYAKEGYADQSRARYVTSSPAKWNWVLTKLNAADAPKSTAKLAIGVGHDEILDHGTYVLDQMPTVVAFNAAGDVGNVYKVPAESMKGVFLVDEGQLVGYQHPTVLKIGGESDHGLPSVTISKRTSAKAIAVSSDSPDAQIAQPSVAKANAKAGAK